MPRRNNSADKTDEDPIYADHMPVSVYLSLCLSVSLCVCLSVYEYCFVTSYDIEGSSENLTPADADYARADGWNGTPVLFAPSI